MITNFNHKTGRYEITANAEMFIIPNLAGKVKDFLIKEKIQKQAENICNSVGKHFDVDNEQLVKVLIYPNDLDICNLY